MKKIITLLFSAGVFATSFAQNGSHQNNDKKNDQYVTTKSNTNLKKFGDHRNNIYTFSAKERDQQINKINHDVNFKIKSIQNNRHITRRNEKEMIKKAKEEKAQQIKMVDATFNSKYNSAYNQHSKYNDSHKH
ncbi:MAG: hypothetical protein ABI472_07965 [Ginsengibacter sp.]